MKPYANWTKKELAKELRKAKKMFTASLKQLDNAQWVEVELNQYKEYLKTSRERLQKVRKERDLAIELLAIRLSP